MKKFNVRTAVFILILLLYAVYAGHYIYKTSFVLDGTRYFSLNDDAMISMRYARNLANGAGLVWNAGGERVEGITNLLWAVYMALFHLFPIPAAKMSLAIQISGAVFMLINIILVKKLAERLTDNPIAIFGAVMLAGFYGPLNNWSLLGMEVSVLVMLVSLAALKALNASDEGRFSVWPYILLGVGTLVRFDMAVPFIVTIAVMAFYDAENRKKHLIYGIGILAAFLIGQTVFRLVYYGVPLPNTYYLKVTGTPLYARIGKGAFSLADFITAFNWIIFLLPYTMLLYRRDKTVVLFLLLWTGQMAYSVYVGGDAWEHKGGANRYLSLAISQFFIVFAAAVEKTLVRLTEAFSGWFKGKERLAVNLLLVVFLAGSMLNVNAVLGTRSWRKWLAIQTPEFADTSKYYVTLGLSIDAISEPGASLALRTAGTIPYFAPDITAIDIYGKSDTVIAQTESHLPGGLAAMKEFRPGHTKWDYNYTILELQPDIIIQVSKDADETDIEILKYIQEHYVIVAENDYGFTVKKDSPFIPWNEVEVVEP
jgi:hypothetical protein